MVVAVADSVVSHRSFAQTNDRDIHVKQVTAPYAIQQWASL
jgi:hypothetical protein